MGGRLFCTACDLRDFARRFGGLVCPFCFISSVYI